MTADHGRPRRAPLIAATRAALAALAAFLLAPAPICAQEWHESYRAGLAALQRGDAARAVEALRRAIALRPEPGRNVVTYGTNVEPRYFPYLRLADAYVTLGQLEAARETLEASASWGREPADERQRLLARLDDGRRAATAALARADNRSHADSGPTDDRALPDRRAGDTRSAFSPVPAASSRAEAPPTPPRSRPSPPAAVARAPAVPPASPPAASVPAGEAVTSTIEIVSRPPGGDRLHRRRARRLDRSGDGAPAEGAPRRPASRARGPPRPGGRRPGHRRPRERPRPLPRQPWAPEGSLALEQRRLRRARGGRHRARRRARLARVPADGDALPRSSWRRPARRGRPTDARRRRDR